MFPVWETQRLRLYNKENLEQCLQSTSITERKFEFNDTMTSLSEKLSQVSWNRAVRTKITIRHSVNMRHCRISDKTKR